MQMTVTQAVFAVSVAIHQGIDDTYEFFHEDVAAAFAVCEQKLAWRSLEVHIKEDGNTVFDAKITSSTAFWGTAKTYEINCGGLVVILTAADPVNAMMLQAYELFKYYVTNFSNLQQKSVPQVVKRILNQQENSICIDKLGSIYCVNDLAKQKSELSGQAVLEANNLSIQLDMLHKINRKIFKPCSFPLPQANLFARIEPLQEQGWYVVEIVDTNTARHAS
ncbi:hypothetical protein C2869_21200 [Saccharobesus litoralis]|uniref:Uncharacterized protein n=1 Tax=Saccharobesus litoralis TaxID=2172099 RepID=A0A2S0VX36_9ALTE|nr:hypothetical protein [Saccharobesus litoralis]AWB68758.1 hypothetical protein C2869_21200 [Saccharobesus litoralis]